jgi:hypothetical protein
MAEAVLSGAEAALAALGPRALAAAEGAEGEDRPAAALPAWAALLRRYSASADAPDAAAYKGSWLCHGSFQLEP